MTLNGIPPSASRLLTHCRRTERTTTPSGVPLGKPRNAPSSGPIRARIRRGPPLPPGLRLPGNRHRKRGESDPPGGESLRRRLGRTSATSCRNYAEILGAGIIKTGGFGRWVFVTGFAGHVGEITWVFGVYIKLFGVCLLKVFVVDNGDGGRIMWRWE